MICNKITFDGETIITIYHKGFIDEINTKERKICESIAGKEIAFIEYFEPSAEVLNNKICIEDGFLDTKSKYNVYKGASNCAKYERFEGDIPSLIFDLERNEPKLSYENLDKIFSFIKTYTGLEVKNDITLVGDSLVFEPRNIDISSENKCKTICINNLEPNMFIIMNFYNSQSTITSTIVETFSGAGAFRVDAPKDWSYIDVSIYKDNELYYKNTCLSFLRNFHLDMSVLNKKSVSLSKFGFDEEITTSYREQIRIGNDSVCQESKKNKLKSIQNKINIHNDKKRIMFFKPNEEKRVLKELSNIFSNAKDELWIIDTYFSSVKNQGYKQDILKLLIESSAKSKLVVFSSTKEESNLENLDKHLLNDKKIIQIKHYGKLNITFKQTIEPIHDRFIISKSFDKIAVYIIGTSFNSLVDNYYCLIKLNDADSQVIYNEIKDLVLDDTFCKTKEY